MIWGATYPNRLWYIRELFTLVVMIVWAKRICIDRANIRDGLRALPVNVMSCKQMRLFFLPLDRVCIDRVNLRKQMNRTYEIPTGQPQLVHPLWSGLRERRSSL